MEYRKIIHVDMDAFYASVEQREHPEFRGRPLVVGRPGERSVVSAASYEARKFGIRSAMPSVKAARLCPDVIFVPGNMELYRSVSAQIHRIFHEYTDLVEPLALDEAFLDVTDNKAGLSLGVEVARRIKQRIRRELGLVASAGVSYNKFLAKIASDFRKPDGLCTIHPDRAQAFIEKLPIEVFWGVGRVTAQKMHALGIADGAALRACSQEFLTRHFGKNGRLYYDFARGIDPRPVMAVRVRKSVGCEDTFDYDLTEMADIVQELRLLAEKLERRMEKADFRGITLTLKVKFDDFTIRSRSVSPGYEIMTAPQVTELAEQLARSPDLFMRPVRLLGLSVSHPLLEKPESFASQLDIDFPEFVD